jgi:hypothetical protein
MGYTRRRYKTRKNLRRKTRRGGAFANRGRAGRNADCREFLAKPTVIAFMKQYLKRKSGKFNPTLEDLKRIDIKIDDLREAYPDLASCYLDRYQMKSARNAWIDGLFSGKNQEVKNLKLTAVKNLPKLPVRGPVVAANTNALAKAEAAAAAAAVAAAEAAEAAEAAAAAAEAEAEAEAAAAPKSVSRLTPNPKVAARLAAAAKAAKATIAARAADPTHTVAAPTSAAAQHLNALELNAERGEAPRGVGSTSAAAQHLNALELNAENPPEEELINNLRNPQLGRTGIQEYKDLFQYINGGSMARVVNTFNFENDQGLLYRIAKFLMLLYDEYYDDYYSGVYENDDTLERYVSFLSPLSTKLDALISDNTLPGNMKNEFQNLKSILPAQEGDYDNILPGPGRSYENIDV